MYSAEYMMWPNVVYFLVVKYLLLNVCSYVSIRQTLNTIYVDEIV